MINQNSKSKSTKQRPVGKQVIYPELSFRIMEIAFEIHKTLGPGFTENIYEAAFVHELKSKEFDFEQQKQIDILYKQTPLGLYRLDLVIENKILIELKAVRSLNDIFKQQVYSYLKASGLKLGLLINFGSKHLESVRIVC